ncbi:DnaD domain protein [Halothermothrix orenii]|uniref:Primosome, DnaD subunit n=1 Tax=Halothermothrix orenii (strain H 168 / OCM 544 / DSM 9562) TaxID=373903 RepID=B8D1A5_HALOH|nr:DnaD domain protein [Halothermothrix orenii]ACL71057.1 primosome, DnaD subunit [Halothermothrix orenii H 168]
MKQVNVDRREKVNITSGSDRIIVEIGKDAVDAGLLKLLPGTSFPVLIYLLTHLERGNYVETNPTIIQSYLPSDVNLEDIENGLKFLSEHGIINIRQEREGDYTYRIYLGLDRLSEMLRTDNSNLNYNFNETEIRDYVINKKPVSREELARALMTFIPPDRNPALLRDEINHWLDDFDFKMIQELIRRVDKWLNNTDNPPEKAFSYLKGIIDDWYRKEIFDYNRLKHFDKLFRETRELARAYGIKGWQNVTPAHMETFQRWLDGKSSLSISVAKFAIKEAIKRKKDGQPSLKYIEDNFIKPWKKAGVKNVAEARKLLARKSPPPREEKNHTRGQKKKKKKKDRWDEFYWDFENFRET